VDEFLPVIVLMDQYRYTLVLNVLLLRPSVVWLFIHWVKSFQKTISLYCKTKLDWAKSDLHNRREADADSPAMWSHPDSWKLVETVVLKWVITKGRNTKHQVQEVKGAQLYVHWQKWNGPNASHDTNIKEDSSPLEYAVSFCS
jgi:hypothetical protein